MTARRAPSLGLLAAFGGRAGVVTAALDREPAMPAVFRLIGLMVHGNARSRQLRQLAALPPHLLDDVGITREQALEALRKG